MDRYAGQDDEQLVVLARAGDNAAFGVLVQRFQGRVYNIALRLSGERQEALDLTQEAFIRAHAALARFDTTRPFAPWLARVATNVALNRLRRRSPTHGALRRRRRRRKSRGAPAARSEYRARAALSTGRAERGDSGGTLEPAAALSSRSGATSLPRTVVGRDSSGPSLAAKRCKEPPVSRAQAAARSTGRKPMSHLNDEELLAYLDDELEPAARAMSEQHLAGCAHCQAELTHWQAMFANVAALPDKPLDVDLTPLVLAAVAPRWSWRAWLLLVTQIAAAAALALWLLPGFTYALGVLRFDLLWNGAVLWLNQQQAELATAVANFENALTQVHVPQFVVLQPLEWTMVLLLAALFWLAGNRLLLKEAQRGLWANLALQSLFLILLVGSLLALIVLCATLFSQLVARAQRNVERMPLRCMLVGLVNFLFFGLLAAALSSGGDIGGLLALLLLTALLSFVALGLTAVAAAIGD
ncbi:sigma-70 family RNA polymerase sigma factor, partial [Candidatus Gracilibacteria bacterium]|nr:sigma-70 family RNA polymerase sigma factor [Candidatus Gracilibacteria bacterium]